MQSPMSRSAEENIRYDSDFSRIEELIKESTFSREEISHLIDILKSRVDNDGEKQKSSIDAGGILNWFHGGMKPEEHHLKKNSKILMEPWLVLFVKCQIHSVVLMAQSSCIEMSLVQTFVQVPVGVSASPIDIARAYMAGRTYEGGYELYNFMSKGERAQPINDFARKPLLPSPSPKPSICWPGAMVHDRHGYTTPQSQRVRHRLHDFSRTPYSRTILSKSSTKLQDDSGYHNTSTSFQQPRTSIYGQVNLRDETNDGHGSVGPIRRIRNKFASEVRPRGSIFLSSSKDIPPKTATPKVLGGFLPSTDKNLEPGETSGASKHWSGDDVSGSSDRAISNPISSSQAVRKILEHLDRNKPTPKEKEAELKLATSWRRSSPSVPSDTIREENISSVHVRDHASLKHTDIAAPNFPVELKKGSSNSNILLNIHGKGMDEAKDAANGNTKASSTTGSSFLPAANSIPSLVLRELIRWFHFPIVGLYCQIGFTFPVSASSGVLSEPPTPSITPSFSASILSQPTSAPAVPSYSFGTKNSKPRLVFSFPSTSTASTSNHSDLKFSFGSEKNTRLSFSNLGTDAICYLTGLVFHLDMN
ncbi:hypothetical protein Sango_1936100 [Sesamum angolense]|uniref:Uncharacterized protein n=1 Tax=Sesamum angolense TaxID=2727404 RepID=A0AAE1WDX4_9LAMI|nr:hypothetical protein Sango_1936100 [Sesamum angolense]